MNSRSGLLWSPLPRLSWDSPTWKARCWSAVRPSGLVAQRYQWGFSWSAYLAQSACEETVRKAAGQEGWAASYGPGASSAICNLDNFGFLSSTRELTKLCPRPQNISVSPAWFATKCGQASPQVILCGETLCCRPTSQRIWNLGLHTMVAATSASIRGTNGDNGGTHHVHRHGQQGFAARFLPPVRNL